MAEDPHAREASASGSLYTVWLGAIESLVRGLAPQVNGAPSAHTDNARAPAFPVERMTQALSVAQGMLGALYGAYFRAMSTSLPGEEGQALVHLVQSRIASFTDELANLGQPASGPSRLAAMSAFLGAPLAAGAQALEPLALNLERTFGGLVDAFGLAPLRDLQEAQRDLSLAAVAHRQAQLEYLEVVAMALGQGAEALTARLVEMGQRGESIDSLLGLVRLWAQATDGAMHRAMQTPSALEASAKLIRASARSRQQQQRVVGILSQALHVPTRAEIDDAFREIQELKREVRRLRKSAQMTTTQSASGVRKERVRQGNGPQPRAALRQASKRQPDRKGAATR